MIRVIGDLVMRTGLWDRYKENVWRGAVSPLKVVSLNIECRIWP